MLGRGVFDFSRKGPFDIEEANEIVRVLNRVTQKYSQKVSDLINKLEALGPSDRQKTTEIEAVIGRLIEEWNGKVRRLGGIPKGLWLVDIDNGQGYYCWKFPEQEVGHWHDYNSGYAGRIPLTAVAGNTAVTVTGNTGGASNTGVTSNNSQDVTP